MPSLRSCAGVERVTQSGSYRRPSWFARAVFNRLVVWSMRLGVSFLGSRILEVRGRWSGELRRVPVNVLSVGDRRYLVAPRGETQWVRNLRKAGEGALVVGGHSEHFQAVEVPVAEREPILRAYLRRWEWEVGRFFGGVGSDSPTEDIERIAPDHPVFRIEA
jgi:deazaflavin-dependent oxidoreductase (nitroreductase family)